MIYPIRVFKLFIAGLFLAVISACGSKNETVVQRVSFQETPMDTVYQALRPEVQKFKVQATETQKVKSKNGTEVLIPAHSFMDGFGNRVSGEVEVNIIEAVELTDFLTSNLQTLSNNRVLESAGMLFIDAKSEGKSLRLAENQQISISMPMMKEGEGFQMFTGFPNQDGSINWIEDSSSNKDYLIPFPGELLYEELTVDDAGYYLWGYWSVLIDSTKYDPRNPEFANTFIHTREFRDRLWELHYGTILISTLLNKDLNWDEHTDLSWRKFYKIAKIDYQLFDLYYSNLNTNIEILDSTATAIVHGFLDSDEFNELLNNREKNRYENWYFSYGWFSDDIEVMKSWITFGEDGARGNVPTFKDYGVDLSSDNAYDQLITNGASSQEALMMINIEKERNAYISEVKRIKEAIEKKAEVQKLAQETVFATSQLGWINCDRFLNDPSAGKAEIIVSIDSDVELEYTDCSLIIPDLNVKLSAFPYGEKQYSFTQANGAYTQLPIGKEALIIGLSTVNGKCFYSYQKIKIEDGTSVTLKMEETDKSELKDKLEEILEPNA